MPSSQEVQRRAVNAYGSFVAEESNLQEEEMPSLDDLAVPRDAVENGIVSKNSFVLCSSVLTHYMRITILPIVLVY